jgi:hypothetical protein
MEKDINYLTLGQAAKATGRSKSTIFKAINNGTLSFIEKTSAGYKLDPEEVFMVFPANDLDSSQGERSRTFSLSTGKHSSENEYLRRENELLRTQLEREREQSDYWRLQATALLTHQPEQEQKPEQPKSLLWQKLFGRASHNK